jgi:predicted  nucleic acid-binding Zn-ribbon protein
MVERARAIEDEPGVAQAAAPAVAPAPVGNRQTAAQLVDGATPARSEDVARLSGMAGNRATANWLGAGPVVAQATPAQSSPAQSSPAQSSPAPNQSPMQPPFQSPLQPPFQLPGPMQSPLQPPFQLPGPMQSPLQPSAPASAPAVPAGPPVDWIDSLDDFIRTQIDGFGAAAYAKAKPQEQHALDDRRTAHRKLFMERLLWLFGSYAAGQAHFQAVGPIDIGGSKIWLHVSARERLMAAQALLKAQDIPMPHTTVALAMRELVTDPGKHGPTYFTHFAGFAVDWRAYQAVHMFDARANALFEAVTEGAPSINTGLTPKQRIDLIIKMGQGTADPAESKKLLDQIKIEYDRVTSDSQAFKDALPAENLELLHRHAVEIDQARKKLAGLVAHQSPKPSDDARQALQDAKDELVRAHEEAVADLATIFEPWVTLLDGRIAALEQQAAGQDVEFGKLTGPFRLKELNDRIGTLTAGEKKLTAELKAQAAEVRRIHQEAADLDARVTAARADPTASEGELDAVAVSLGDVFDALDPVENDVRGLLPDIDFEPKPTAPARYGKGTVAALRAAADRLPGRLNPVAKKVTALAETLPPATTELTGAREERDRDLAYNESKVEALGGGTDKAALARGRNALKALLELKVQWLRFRDARKGLLEDTDDFVFKSATPRAPGVAQLVGQQPGAPGGALSSDAPGGATNAKAGKWDPSHGYNAAFMAAMVTSGFETGAAWQGESDSMHFELAEGRRRLETNGKEPLVAGAKLQAAEDAAKKKTP